MSNRMTVAAVQELWTQALTKKKVSDNEIVDLRKIVVQAIQDLQTLADAMDAVQPNEDMLEKYARWQEVSQRESLDALSARALSSPRDAAPATGYLYIPQPVLYAGVILLTAVVTWFVLGWIEKPEANGQYVEQNPPVSFYAMAPGEAVIPPAAPLEVPPVGAVIAHEVLPAHEVPLVVEAQPLAEVPPAETIERPPTVARERPRLFQRFQQR